MPDFTLKDADSASLREDIEKICATIKKRHASISDPNLVKQGQKRLNNLTKPLGSLGRLEDFALKLYCLAEGKKTLCVTPSMLFTVAGDHGVVAEGVASNPQEVTSQMVLNFLAGGAGINAICHSTGMELMVVDAGVIGQNFPEHEKLWRAKISEGTKNIAQGPAMTEHECLEALCTGIHLARFAATKGMCSIAAGEMGIGNTTPSAALYCAFLGMEPEKTVGVGAGLAPEKLGHKAAVIKKALEVNTVAIASADPFKILAAVGGLEIAVISGIILGAAEQGLPFIVDGFIAGAAFTAASKIAPEVLDYCFFGHKSAEAGHCKALENLGQKAILDLDLRLGEGTGAALTLPILKATCAIFNDMASFEQAGVTAVEGI